MESTSVWQGALVRLRAVEPGDWESFYAWNQDDELARHLDQIPFPQSREAVRRWAERVSTAEPGGDDFRWLIEDRSGEVVGAINTHTCDRRVGTFSYGLTVRPEHRRRGYAQEAVRLVLRYSFEELGYQKVTVHVYDVNRPPARLHEKLGFRLEGRLRRMVCTRGRHWDVLVYGLTRDEFDQQPPAGSDQPVNPR